MFETRDENGFLCQVATLASRVLVVAVLSPHGDWAAYIDSVPGKNHTEEWAEVARGGIKLDEKLAHVLFPHLKRKPYRE